MAEFRLAEQIVINFEEGKTLQRLLVPKLQVAEVESK